MKILFITLMAFISCVTFSQTGSLMTKEGKIHYEVVDSSIAGTASEIYDRAKMWFVEAFKSANAVIQLDDKDNMLIIGKGHFDFTHNLQPYEVWFTVKFNVKDGKYRAQFYNVKVEAGSNDWEVPGEWFIEKKARSGERQKMSHGFEDMLSHLKNFMSKKPDNDF